MQLGNFSISLAVKDIAVSRAFYEKLGFSVWGGEQEENWLILKNGSTVIGLFQGMFERNILTFNPGWDSNANPLEDFTDVPIDSPEFLVGFEFYLSTAYNPEVSPSADIIAEQYHRLEARVAGPVLV